MRTVEKDSSKENEMEKHENVEHEIDLGQAKGKYERDFFSQN